MHLITSRRTYAANCVKEVTVYVEWAHQTVVFNFHCKTWNGVVSRNVKETIPTHILSDIRGFVLSGAAAPLLDYLSERNDLPERFANAVTEAMSEFNTPRLEN